MTLLSSLSTGVTGLNAASTDLSTISDNIANANTVGFKEARVNFADALAQNLVTGGGAVGLGAQVESIQKIMAQGALSNTSNATDLGLQGPGFFEVRGTTNDGRQGSFLTRNGQFTVDKDGFLVNTDGLRVQGFGANAAGGITSQAGDLQIGNASSAPLATSTVTIKANLQSDAPVPVNPWDPADATNTSNFATSVTLFDSLGKSYQAPIYFRNDDGGSWEWHAVTDGANVGGTAGTLSEIASGTLQFDQEGRLIDSANQTSDFNPTNALQPQVLTFKFGTDFPGGSGLDGVTQFANSSATTFVGQDGFGAGTVSSIQIDKSGVINGVFTNGETRALGQVAVANVAAQDKLERVGGTLYQTSRASGDAVLGVPGTGGRAFVSAGTLEQSNVDIAEQFVRMISAQRNFEANSKTITTADQLLSELIALKR
jgi:flagellar hook protein FlgE